MLKKIKKIAVVTGTRAEYGILKPLLVKIKKSGDFKLDLLVTGMHLLKKYGLTVKEIERDGFNADEKVEMYGDNQAANNYHGEALGNGIINFTRKLIKIKPDVLIVAGDRLEPLAAVLAAANLAIPILHFHGGEKTDSGHIDESNRHAMTRFAHIHFTSTDMARKRLLKMGEEPRRIFNVGALGLDSIVNSPKADKAKLYKKFKLNFRQKLILCLFHPVFLENENIGGQVREAIDALEQINIQTIFIYPNNDIGSNEIIAEIEKHKNLPFLKIQKNLNHDDYVNLLKYADVLIGNSSSGIIEAPSLELPAVNIGIRNKGREHGANVIFVHPKKKAIISAIKEALTDKKFQKRMATRINPYGNGNTTQKVYKILKKIEINKRFLTKKISY